MPYLVEHKDKTLRLTLSIQPRASRTRIVGLHGDTVKLAITAPPVDGKANAAVISYIAAFFKIPKQAVHVQSGKTSRTKILAMENISLAEAQALLDQALASGS
jgi:uncharacterized protein (TIGR00251 family)